MDLIKQVQQENPICIDDAIDDVFDFFRHNQDTSVVPVVDKQGYAQGILKERDLKSFVYAQFGKEILLKKNIKEFLHKTSICDADTKIDTLLELFTQEKNRDGIIITKGGKYFGFLNAVALLKLVYEQNLEQKRRESVDSLIVGIAHELNTPIGICITATSYLMDKVEELSQDFREGKMKKSSMENFLSGAKETCDSLYKNLNRSSSLVQSFKQVSVDRKTEEKREIKIFDFVKSSIFPLEKRMDQQSVSFELECDKDLEVMTYPESFSEALKILIDNSLDHGFENEYGGKIKLMFEKKGEYVRLEYSDNGCGIKEEEVGKIFEPFYTTKRGKGKPGLGLHILQNMIVHKMRGMIQCESESGKGTRFIVQIPTS